MIAAFGEDAFGLSGNHRFEAGQLGLDLGQRRQPIGILRTAGALRNLAGPERLEHEHATVAEAASGRVKHTLPDRLRHVHEEAEDDGPPVGLNHVACEIGNFRVNREPPARGQWELPLWTTIDRRPDAVGADDLLLEVSTASPSFSGWIVHSRQRCAEPINRTRAQAGDGGDVLSRGRLGPSSSS